MSEQWMVEEEARRWRMKERLAAATGETVLQLDKLHTKELEELVTALGLDQELTHTSTSSSPQPLANPQPYLWPGSSLLKAGTELTSTAMGLVTSAASSSAELVTSAASRLLAGGEGAEVAARKKVHQLRSSLQYAVRAPDGGAKARAALAEAEASLARICGEEVTLEEEAAPVERSGGTGKKTGSTTQTTLPWSPTTIPPIPYAPTLPASTTPTAESLLLQLMGLKCSSLLLSSTEEVLEAASLLPVLVVGRSRQVVGGVGTSLRAVMEQVREVRRRGVGTSSGRVGSWVHLTGPLVTPSPIKTVGMRRRTVGWKVAEGKEERVDRREEQVSEYRAFEPQTYGSGSVEKEKEYKKELSKKKKKQSVTLQAFLEDSKGRNLGRGRQGGQCPFCARSLPMLELPQHVANCPADSSRP